MKKTTTKTKTTKKTKPAAPALEQITTFNLRVSVECLPTWDADTLAKYLSGEFEAILERLGGDHGPRFDVSRDLATIVELDPDNDPHWKIADVLKTK